MWSVRWSAVGGFRRRVEPSKRQMHAKTPLRVGDAPMTLQVNAMIVGERFSPS